MRYIAIILLTLITVSGWSQVKLTQIEKDSIKFRLPVAQRVVPGQSGYFLRYMTVPTLFDSLGIEMHDSIYVRNDSILLRDGQGLVAMKAGWGLTVSSAGDSIIYAADTTKLATLTDIIRGRGVATRVAFWGKTDSLSSNANLYWDNVNSRLGVGTNTLSNTLNVLGNSLLNGYLRVNGDNNIWIQHPSIPIPPNAGDQNTIIGFNVGNPSGMPGAINNFFLGSNTALATTTGDNNIVIGANNFNTQTSASDNIVIGNGAFANSLNSNTSIVIGKNAGTYSTFSYGGTFVGSNAGAYSTYDGTAYGENSLRFNTGANNVAIGTNSGYENSGSNCLFLGFNAGNGNYLSNKLYIDNSNTIIPLIGGDFNNNMVGVNLHVNQIGRTLDVNGEVRIRDLTTDTPTRIIGADADGDLGELSLGSGLNIVNGTLNTTNSGTVTSVTASSPLSSSGGTTPNISMSQSGSGSNGWLSSTDWNTFNNKTNTRLRVGGVYYSGDLDLGTRNTGTYPAWAYSSGTIYYDLPAGSSGQVLKHNGTGWTAGADNAGSYSYWSLQANGGSLYNVGNTFNVNFANSTGISWSQNGSGTITATVSDQSPSNELQSISTSGAAGNISLSNGGGTLNLNVNDADASPSNELQTLSFSSPNLSISSGNTVALPVLPSGTSNQTLRYNGGWEATSGVTVTSSNRMDINNWGGSVNLGSRLLVNGHIQYTNTGMQALTLTGRDSDGGLTNVPVGTGLGLVAGTLTNSTIFGQLTNDGCTSVSTSWGTTLGGSPLSNGVSISSNTITVPSNGTYEVNISGWFAIQPVTSASLYGIRARKNGSSNILQALEDVVTNTIVTSAVLSKSIIVNLSANDTIQLQATRDNTVVSVCDTVLNIKRIN